MKHLGNLIIGHPCDAPGYRKFIVADKRRAIHPGAAASNIILAGSVRKNVSSARGNGSDAAGHDTVAGLGQGAFNLRPAEGNGTLSAGHDIFKFLGVRLL